MRNTTTIRRARSLSLFLIVLFGAVTRAETPFPPLLETIRDYECGVKEIRDAVPETYAAFHTNTNYKIETILKEEQQLIRYLMQDAEYMKEAAKRTPLQAFRVRQWRDGQVARELILQEVSPHLAAFRSGPGGDCSSHYSWAFPYSPYERVWFVKDLACRNIGYISGTITEVEGKPNLFIRDATGVHYSTGDIRLLLSALYKVRQQYGAEQMTFMSWSFAEHNHFPSQVEELRSGVVASAQDAEQTFLDNKWRELFVKEFGLSEGWDGTGQHKLVRKLAFEDAALNDIEVKSVDKEIANLSPKTNADSFYHLLNIAVRAQDFSSFVNLYAGDGIDWEKTWEALRNAHGLPVQEYFKSVQNVFLLNGFPYSKNLFRKNERVFLGGYLRAPDAFQGDNLRQGVRYLIELLWRPNTPQEFERSREFIAANLDALEANELFTRHVQGMFSRLMSPDRERIELLWNAGYRFKSVVLPVGTDPRFAPIKATTCADKLL